MLKLRLLNKKKVKEIEAILEKQWDATLEGDYAFFMNNEDKIFITNPDVAEFVVKYQRINSCGVYIGQLTGTEIRLSIEGSQLIGKTAKKNVFELNRGLLQLWIRGHNIPINEEGRTMYLMKYDHDFIGTGKLIDGTLINYIPKERRVKSVD